MIGQQDLINIIDRDIESDRLARFDIIVGERGSEKNEIGPYIADRLKANCVVVTEVKVDTIRTIIQEAYRVITPTVYVIVDADSISVQAQNALLKVTEEPPNKAYFVMTLEDETNTLPTIRSRGTVYHCDLYSQATLVQYAQDKYNGVEHCELCSTPGEIDLLHSYNATEFYGYVQRVYGNIATVSGANCFKIADKIKLKDTDEGYDLTLFWKLFQYAAFEDSNYNRLKITSTYLGLLHKKAINRVMLFDQWILSIRKLGDGDN